LIVVAGFFPSVHGFMRTCKKRAQTMRENDCRICAIVLCMSLLLMSECAYSQHYPRQAVSAGYSGFVMYGSVSAEYEFLASEQVSFRLGFGGAYGSVVVSDVEAVGGTAMFSFMSRGIEKVEAGIGFSVMRTNFAMIFSDVEPTTGTTIFPALSLAYRTLPPRSGMFWRIGIAWVLGYGLPVTIGVGWVF
jgi:hypothetical protein